VPLHTPALLLAADHRARGVITVEPYDEYLAALRAALPSCDGVLASAQPLADLVSSGLSTGQSTYLSLNRTGLAGSAFELDDRLVASVDAAAERGYSGVKHMTRIDRADAHTPAALELLGQVLEAARQARLEALIEVFSWRDGQMSRGTDDVVAAAVIAHDLGAPLLKVPVPEADPGPARVDGVARVVASVGVPVLFLGGPRPDDGPSAEAVRQRVLAEVHDVLEGGGAGLALGRVLYQDPDPAAMAAAVAALVHR
jgi:DhnA family fructose-bisphosphate aldolase class Ia